MLPEKIERRGGSNTIGLKLVILTYSFKKNYIYLNISVNNNNLQIVKNTKTKNKKIKNK